MKQEPVFADSEEGKYRAYLLSYIARWCELREDLLAALPKLGEDDPLSVRNKVIDLLNACEVVLQEDNILLDAADIQAILDAIGRPS